MSICVCSSLDISIYVLFPVNTERLEMHYVSLILSRGYTIRHLV